MTESSDKPGADQEPAPETPKPATRPGADGPRRKPPRAADPRGGDTDPETPAAALTAAGAEETPPLPGHDSDRALRQPEGRRHTAGIRTQSIASWILTVLAGIAVAAAVVGYWAHETLLDTDKFMAAVTPAVESDAVKRSWLIGCRTRCSRRWISTPAWRMRSTPQVIA